MKNKILKIGLLSLALTLIFFMLFADFTELKTVEIIQFIIAVPLATVVFIYLFEAKFSEFNSKLINLENNLNKTVMHLDTEREQLKMQSKDLKGEIIELKHIVKQIDKDIKILKKRR